MGARLAGSRCSVFIYIVHLRRKGARNASATRRNTGLYPELFIGFEQGRLKRLARSHPPAFFVVSCALGSKNRLGLLLRFPIPCDLLRLCKLIRFQLAGDVIALL